MKEDDVELLLHPPKEKKMKVVIEGATREVVEEASKKFREEHVVTMETGIMSGTRKLYRDSEVSSFCFNIIQHKGKRTDHVETKNVKKS